MGARAWRDTLGLTLPTTMRSTLNVMPPDGSRKVVPAGTAIREVGRSIGRRLAGGGCCYFDKPSPLHPTPAGSKAFQH